MMNKKIKIMLILIAAVFILAGCSVNKDRLKSDPDKINIVCTTFPQYDWMRQLIKGNEDRIELKLLIDNGVDMHSYQATVDDIILLSECDLIVYVGGESDAWVDDAIKQSTNTNLRTVNMMDSLGDMVKEEEIVEGMQDAHEHEHEEEDAAEGAEDGNKHDHVEYDEHVWLSLRNAEYIIGRLSDELKSLDPDGAADYEKNAEAYIDELSSLDAEYQAVVDNAELKTVLFGDRFPFRYMADDYGISYYAAFVGCSAETEASFETITFLADKIEELSLDYVLVIENTETELAQTIIDSSEKKDVQIMTLDSVQSVSRDDIDAGVSYLGIMEKNLEVLKTVLK